MACSQVYSQHPSHCVFSDVHRHRSWVPNNAEVCCGEPETSEAYWLGNTILDGQGLSSKGYACSSYGNPTSPFQSSWIRRLIPSHSTRVEQPQPLDKLHMENRSIDRLRTNWKRNADHLTTFGNQSDFPVYENSRRSEQDFFTSQKTYLGTNTPCVQNGVNIRLLESPDALPPEIQVSPKPLPVVESLLPGSSKQVLENQKPRETNIPHILSRCTGSANPMKQTVHYSTDEKSRVSCSSIVGLNSRSSLVCAAGDLLALKSLQIIKRCVGPSQPFSEFSFDNIDAVTRSDMDPTSGAKERQTGTHLRTHRISTQTENLSINLHSESRHHELHEEWASCVAKCLSVEDRLLDGYSMPYREEAVALGFSIDQSTCPETVRRNCWKPKEHCSYAHVGFEAGHTRKGAFCGGWWSIQNSEKDELPPVPNLALLHCGANVAKEKAGISLSHDRIEQELGSSHGSHEEQGETSRSFSFHCENRLASELDHAKVVTRKGQWPFGLSTLSSEGMLPSRCSEDNRARGLAEASRAGTPLESCSVFQETVVREAGTAYIGTRRPSPFFRAENLNESTSRSRDFDNHNVPPRQAACIDIRGVSLSGMNTEALPGGRTLSRPQSNLMIEEVKGKEMVLSFPSRTVSVKNWKLFKPGIQSRTLTSILEGARLNHTEGNCVSVDNWKAHKPCIRSSTHTCLPEGAQLNHADGNLCFSTGSIGSCSQRSANFRFEDPSTSADARSRSIAQEKPAALPSRALQKQLQNSQRHRAGTGANAAPDDDRESEGKEAVDSEMLGSSVKQNLWLKRWSTIRSRKVHALSMPNREGTGFADTTNARNYVGKDYGTSQDSRESYRCLDLRPAKRVCYEKRSGLQSELGNAISKIGSVAVGREHKENSVASHFMKRFFAPSAAAMAIMGMTARKVHATQPQGRGLFGIWASNASVRKSCGTQADVCGEFSTRPNCKKKGFMESYVKAPPTPAEP